MLCGVYTATAAIDMGSKRLNRKQSVSEIVFKQCHFLITDRPTDATLDAFIEELSKNKVKDLVRVCDASYSTARLEEMGIHVVDCKFEDGSPPPDAVVDEWFHLLKTRFKECPDGCVAVHCVAGLGRAPVLVALALMELGMNVEDAVELIRQKRRGAINQKQMDYLRSYRPKSRLRVKGISGGSVIGSSYSSEKGCTIQ